MTTSDDRRTHWQKVWTTKPPETVSWHQTAPTLSLALIEAAGLRKDAGVVDVGGGASELVDRLSERGWVHLAVLDVSEAALNHAVERLGPLADDITWIESDVLEWRPVPGLFELWHDRACFHFLTDEGDQRKYAEVMATALVPGGMAIIATFAMDGPETCSGLTVERPDEENLARVLGPQFELMDQLTENHVTPGGAVQKFSWWVWRRL
ncbi:MAG: class I SAM-dependent methyltransferase [Rhodospirillaceae bacterium]|nr:class I SAM-dependent methyltransferase [Rhodospirillales bacterium]